MDFTRYLSSCENHFKISRNTLEVLKYEMLRSGKGSRVLAQCVGTATCQSPGASSCPHIRGDLQMFESLEYFEARPNYFALILKTLGPAQRDEHRDY